jgi:hypothetical protein
LGLRNLPIERYESILERLLLQRELGMGLEAGKRGKQRRQKAIEHDGALSDLVEKSAVFRLLLRR